MAFQDPLYRFYEREVNLGCKILKRVRSDLRDIIAICRGEKKQTNDHRSIIDDLNRFGHELNYILLTFLNQGL